MATCKCYRNYVVSSVLVPLAKISNLGGQPSNLVRWQNVAWLSSGWIHYFFIKSQGTNRLSCLLKEYNVKCHYETKYKFYKFIGFLVPQSHAGSLNWHSSSKVRETLVYMNVLCQHVQCAKDIKCIYLFSGSIHFILFFISYLLYSLLSLWIVPKVCLVNALVEDTE